MQGTERQMASQEKEINFTKAPETGLFFWRLTVYLIKHTTMTTTQIRAEIIEMINSGILSTPKIISFFKKNRPEANLESVKEEAKELVQETKSIIKRGY